MATLVNAAAVLRCFSAQRLELSVTEVSTRLSLPKSTVSRLLRAMLGVGFLEAVPGTSRYRPGLLMFELGHTYRRGSTLLAQARAAMERVSRRCGHTGYVSLLDGGDVLGIAAREGTKVLRAGTPPGIRLRAFATATGCSLLARRSDAAVRALYPAPLRPSSEHSPTDMEALLRHLELIRREGFARSRHEANEGAASLAVAVGDPVTGEELSLCIVYPTSLVEAAERDAIRDALLTEACDIAARTGDPHHPAGRAAARAA